MKNQYTHIHPIFGKLKFLKMSPVLGCAIFARENEFNTFVRISETQVYKPNNLTNIPHIAPIPIYSGSY